MSGETSASQETCRQICWPAKAGRGALAASGDRHSAGARL